MDIKELVSLVNAGFSKDEILQLLTPAAPAAAPAAPTAAPAAPAAAPAAPEQDRFAELLAAIRGVNINTAGMPAEQPITAESAIASIINPYEEVK